jgi:hypothetical protein
MNIVPKFCRKILYRLEIKSKEIESYGYGKQQKQVSFFNIVAMILESHDSAAAVGFIGIVKPVD